MPEFGGAVISPSHDYYLLEEREHKWSLKLCQTFQTFMEDQQKGHVKVINRPFLCDVCIYLEIFREITCIHYKYVCVPILDAKLCKIWSCTQYI